MGNLDRRALTPQSVNLIVKARAKQAGLDPSAFSAHGCAPAISRSGQSWYSVAEACTVAAQIRDAGRDYYNDADRKWAGLRAHRLTLHFRFVPIC